MRHCRHRRFALGLVLVALGTSACGAGTAAIVGGSSSGDGGASNAPTTVGTVVVPAARTSPATVGFRLFDPEGDRARVRLRYFEPGDSLDESVDLMLVDPLPDTVETSPGGEDTVVEWDFAAQLGITDFVPGFTVVVTVNGEDDVVSLGNAALVDLGNDPAEVLDVTVPAPTVESAGPVPIPILLRDPAGDPVMLVIQFEHPSGAWLPARLAGLAPGPTDPVTMSGVPTDDDGLGTTFVWDSAHDLRDMDAEVRLRVAVDDGLVRTDFLETDAFHVDNNSPPAVRLLDASLVTNDDEREGIAVPFVVTDDESDPIDVVIQWRLAGEAFPALDLEPEALRAALADPVQRRALQIVSERPVVHDGRVGRLPAGFDPLRHVRLPELGHDEIHAVARGLAGRVLEFPRSLVPRPVAEHWTEHVLARPVAALATPDGLGALVLDEPAPGSWRLIEIELESGAARRLVTSGAGIPRTLTADAPDGWFVGVELGAEVEIAWIAADGALRGTLLGSEHGVSGPLRGLAGVGRGGYVATAGSALFEGRFEDAGARARVLLDDLAEPWGVVVDPADPGRAYFAERAALGPGASRGRVSAFDLVSRVVHPLPTSSALWSPSALALDRERRLLYVLCDADPADERLELRGLHLGGPGGLAPFTVTEEVPSGASSLALGSGELCLLALPEDDDLAVGGGVHARRTIVSEGSVPPPYDRARQVVRLEPPLLREVPAGSAWRLLGTLGRARSSPAGTLDVLTWDMSRDIAQDDDVVLRAIPLDGDLGLLDESIVAKHASVFEFDEESEPTSIATPFVTTDFVTADIDLADFDGDGQKDLVLTGTTANAIALYFQDEAGSFPAAPDRLIALPAGTRAGDILCGDVGGDGLADLVVAYESPGAIAIFEQGAAGLSSEPDELLDLPGVPGKLALADLDADGRPEILASCLETNDVRRLRPGAGGRYELSPGRMLLGNGGGGGGVVAGDVDGDGDLDVVAAKKNTGSALLFPQAANGGFPLAPAHTFPMASVDNQELLLEDMNGDGTPDLLVVSKGNSDTFDFGGISVFHLGAEALPSQPAVVIPVQGGRQIAVHDFDRNGVMDVVAASYDSGFFGGHSGLRILLQRDGLFEPLLTLDPGQYVRVRVDDLGADGTLEVVALDRQGTLRIWTAARGRLELEEPDDLLLAPGSLGPVAVADFDGDGLVDLLEAKQSGLTLRLQESPRLFQFLPEVALPSVQERRDPRQVADLNGDGRLDVVTRDANWIYTIQYQRGQGSALAFEPGEPIGAGGYELLGLDDLDGDGRFDLSFLSQDAAPSLEVHLGTAAGTFATIPDRVVPLALLYGHVQLADLNADGRPDLLDHSTSGVELRVFLGEEGAIFPSTHTFALSIPGLFGDLGDILVEDLDRDGLPDLVFGLRLGLVVFYQRTTGFLPSPDLRIPVIGALSLGLGDFDEDGALDVVGHSSPGLMLFRETAPRRLGLLGGPLSGQGQPSLHVVDLDLDGSPDAVATFGSLVALHYGK